MVDSENEYGVKRARTYGLARDVIPKAKSRLPKFESKAKRIRGTRGDKIRAVVLSHSPLCVRCLTRGRVREAVEVDHIVALVNGGEESLSPFVNRQSLCKQCHVEKTNEDLGRGTRRAYGADGWPIE